MKLSTIPFEETCKISRDYAITAIKTLDDLHHQKDGPLRFIYMSGHFAPRSAAEMPKELQNHGLINYGLLRVCMEDVAGSRIPLPTSPYAMPHINRILTKFTLGRGRDSNPRIR